jgi:glutamate-1-semialdehyde aminotransferase
VYLPPSGYELWSLGTAHGDETTERTVEAAASFSG